MKFLWIIVLLVLAGCQAHIQIDWTDPVTGAANSVVYESARKAAISAGPVTIIMGEVAINNETVQILGREAIRVADPLDGS